MNRLVRSPYFWVMVAVAAVVGYAYTARDRYQQAAVLAGAQAPDFTFPTLSGGSLGLSDLEDHVVLVNVWATWCQPCREEMPSMQRLYEALEGEDFEILAVSVDAALGEKNDETEYEGGDVGAFAREFGLTFPILRDPSATMLRRYQVVALPETFVVAKNGQIWKKIAGTTEWDLPVNQDLIRRLLDS